MTQTASPPAPLERMARALALSLVCAPAFAFALAQALLLLGGDMAGFGGALVGLAALGGSGWIAYRSDGWRSVAALAAAVAFALLANQILIDTSYDGQGYHFDATEALHEGWNPYYEPYALPQAMRAVAAPQIWEQHYPQAGWLAAAAFRALGAGTEAAKASNLLLALALFCAAFTWARTVGLKRLLALVLAVIAAANPIILNQLFTRMNDGALGSCYALAALFALLWMRERNAWLLLGVAAPIIFALNLKFSAIPIFVILCVLLSALAFTIAGRDAAFRLARAMLAAGVAGVLVFGAHPYVTNLMQNGHPLYPLMGHGAVDIMTGNRPEGFNAISPAARLWTGYFSPTSNSYDGVHGVKLPFTIRTSEIRAAGEYDPRLAGFGPFFSGAGLIAIGLAVWLLWRKPRTKTTLVVVGFTTAAVVFALIMPESWWARYAPQIWWAPLLIAAAAWFSDSARTRIAGWVVVGVLGLNCAVVAASSALYEGGRSLAIYKQSAAIEAAAPACVYLGVSHARAALLNHNVQLSPTPLNAACATTPLASSFPLGGDGAGFCTCPHSPGD